MKKVLLFLIVSINTAFADNIENYMKIANNIPVMEMKSAPEAQAWARSAHNVLTITSESIAETLIQANDVANTQHAPLFCLPTGTILNAELLNQLIQATYKENAGQEQLKSMTVSQVAFMAVTKKYPCQASTGVMGGNTTTQQLVTANN